ncbi:MAG: heme ABC transporter ATP-binding protein [Firmicutes bacterium HGW-Firmicutes-11]|jgi:ATPase subunit of ABC transporter with duplicated ATPase domains|nr:MAG: heme ABC transporter ATP-binding protein [Firmicutes bacterium HGW-Firmicutes-11]
MSLLNVENVTHGFGARRILEDASFRLLKGEHIGLIGANGEGKSTFLNIITGALAPDEGKIEWSKRATVGYLDQSTSLRKGMTIREVLREAFQGMFDLEQEMLALYEDMATAADGLDEMMEDAGEIQHMLEHSGFYTLDAKIDEMANGLGLGSIGLEKDVSDLSGGQRTKVLLTKLLLQDPSILILDEPTNFLDYEQIEWLKKYLQEYENSFILVSHDMEFLNSVVNVIYHVNDGELTRYSGNYDKFQQMYAVKRNQEQKAFDRQQQEIERMEDFIARNKARVATRGMANSRQKMLDKIDILEKPRDKPKPSFAFKEARTPSRFIAEGKQVVLGYGEPLTRPVDFALERGQKIAVCGTNGLGKTTLLRTILNEISPVSGRVELGDFLVPAYYAQDEERDSSDTALESLWKEFPSYTNAEVRAALAKCGLTNEHITSQMKVLSGGENAKARLCKLMQRETNWLILDEPTNHLDVEAKAELKRSLMAFRGTVLLVCHEPDFYQDWITDVWNVEDWTLKII